MISIYDINVHYDVNKVYFKSKKKIGEIPDFTLDEIENIQDYLIFDAEEIYDRIEMDNTYYMIKEDPWEIVGVISMHKGWTFIDCAEHDERVVIKCAFPDKICNIIGE